MVKSDDTEYLEYCERNTFWQNIVMSHPSFSIHSILLINIVFLCFIFININFNELLHSFTFKNFLVLVSGTTGIISVFFGIFCVLIRIADFTISKNICTVKNTFNSKIKKLNIQNGGLVKIKKKKSAGSLFSIIFKTKKFLVNKQHQNFTSENYLKKKKKINKTLMNLKYWKKRLGKNTRFFHRWQIIFFTWMIFIWIIAVFW